MERTKPSYVDIDLAGQPEDLIKLFKEKVRYETNKHYWYLDYPFPLHCLPEYKFPKGFQAPNITVTVYRELDRKDLIRFVFSGMNGLSDDIKESALRQFVNDIFEDIHNQNTDKNPVDQGSNPYKFTFVRNPYSRILSAYLDKITRKKQHLKYSYTHLVSKGSEPSFDDLCEYLAKVGLYDNIHWAPQTSILLLPVNNFDFIGKTENLEADFRTVLQSIGQADALPELKNRAPNYNTNADKKIEKYYTPKTRAIISELYKKDFELLKYRT